jgi:hypothetical protein
MSSSVTHSVVNIVAPQAMSCYRTYSLRPQYASRLELPRYLTADSTSSASSANSDSNEDWTKILDLNRRSRIQNRIAQRNYRKCPGSALCLNVSVSQLSRQEPEEAAGRLRTSCRLQLSTG